MPYICFLSIASLTESHRIRALRVEPYSQKEAEAAVGLRTDNGIRDNVLAVTSERQPAT